LALLRRCWACLLLTADLRHAFLYIPSPPSASIYTSRRLRSLRRTKVCGAAGHGRPSAIPDVLADSAGGRVGTALFVGLSSCLYQRGALLTPLLPGSAAATAERLLMDAGGKLSAALIFLPFVVRFLLSPRWRGITRRPSSVHRQHYLVHWRGVSGTRRTAL